MRVNPVVISGTACLLALLALAVAVTGGVEGPGRTRIIAWIAFAAVGSGGYAAAIWRSARVEEGPR